MNIKEMMRNAESLVQGNQLREAEEQYLLIIQYDHENKEAYNNLGFIAFSQMNIEKAITLFKKAIDIDPLYMDAILNLCDVLRSTNALAMAVPIIEKALALNPENSELREILTGGAAKNRIGQADTTPERMDHVQRTPGYPKGDLTRRNAIKVIHLPLIIANTAITLSKYLNRLGVDSKVISYFRTWLNYQGDINLDLDGLNVTDRNKKVREFVDYFFEHEAHKYDIFHFHFFDSLATGTSFGGWKSHPEREDYWDLQKLKEMGKKIVVSSWGSDVRNNSKIVYYQLAFEELSSDIPYPPLNRKNQYYKIWKFSQHADAVIHGDTEHRRHTPYGMMIPIPIDPEPLDAVRADTDQNTNKFSIIAAPSNQFYKGSQYALRLVERIKTRYGNTIDFRMIHGQAYAEALKSYVGTGIAIEGINFTTGLFALEAMYLGRRVLCCMKAKEFSPGDPKLSPLFLSVNNEEELFQQAVACIEGQVPIEAEALKDFVHDHFSADVVASQYKELYEKMVANEVLSFTVNRQWMTEFDFFIKQQKIDQRDYYPRVTDLLIRKKRWPALFHEIEMGQGLNNDCELLTKYIVALEATGQGDQAEQVRKNNLKATLTDDFKNYYRRAKTLLDDE